MSTKDEQIIEKIRNLRISKKEAETIVNSMSSSDKSRALTDPVFLRDICMNPTPPAGPIPIPYPNMNNYSDTNGGTKKVKIENKEVAIKDKLSYKKSAGDEAGTSSAGGIRKINSTRILESVNKIFTLIGGMEPAIHKMLVTTLLIGLLSGYGIGLIPYNNLKKNSLSRISELDDTLLGKEAILSETKNDNLMLHTQLNEVTDELRSRNEDLARSNDTILNLQGRIGSLEERNVLQNVTISNLQNSLANAETQIQVYIDEIQVDVENDRIIVVLRNPSSFNAVITSLIMYTSDVIYRDTSEDATGIILGGEVVGLVWTEEDSSAPPDYINDDSDYVIFATTLTGYSDWHIYRVVKMEISLFEWRLFSDEMLIKIRNSNLAAPFPSVEVLGVSKVGVNGSSIFYNITDPTMIQEGTIGGGEFIWNEFEAFAPEGFLRLNSEYVIRVIYGQAEQWLTWDKLYTQKTIYSPTIERNSKNKEVEW